MQSFDTRAHCIEDKLWCLAKSYQRHVVFVPGFISVSAWILSALSRYYVTYTHTRECKWERTNKILEIPFQLACPFVMLIGQITQHHSKLNGWLITLKLRARCFVCQKASAVSIFSSLTLGGSVWLTGKSFIKIWLRRNRDKLASHRFECSVAFSSLIQHRYW